MHDINATVIPEQFSGVGYDLFLTLNRNDVFESILLGDLDACPTTSPSLDEDWIPGDQLIREVEACKRAHLSPPIFGV
jgi:hypothetical protein